MKKKQQNNFDNFLNDEKEWNQTPEVKIEDEDNSSNNDGYNTSFNKTSNNNIESENEIEAQNEIENNEFTAYDLNLDNDFDGILKVLQGTLSDNDGETDFVLKITKPFSVVKDKTNPNAYDMFSFKTLEEKNLAIAQSYKTLLKVFQLAWSKNLNENIKQDIEDCFKVFLYSDSDVIESNDNRHQHFLNENGLIIHKRYFAKKNLNYNDRSIPINTLMLDSDVIEQEIKELQNSFGNSSLGQERKQEHLKEIQKRISECENIDDYNCFEIFKLVFPNKQERKQKMLELFKVINYLAFFQLRKWETLNDEKNKDKTAQSLMEKEQISNNAVNHIKVVVDNVLNSSYEAKLQGQAMSLIGERIYSTDIINYYGWKTFLLDWFAKICFGKMYHLYINENTQQAKKQVSLHNVLNDTSLLKDGMKKQLLQRTLLMHNPQFIDIGLDNYVNSLIFLINEHSYNDNTYWDYYYFYLNNYKDTELNINGIKIHFNQFQYLTWLIATGFKATLTKYWNALFVMKYCNTYSIASMNQILTTWNGIKAKGTRKSGYSELDTTWFEERYKPFLLQLYNQVSFNTISKFSLSLNEFKEKYNNKTLSDEE